LKLDEVDFPDATIKELFEGMPGELICFHLFIVYNKITK
jgi:hypothetical protein